MKFVGDITYIHTWAGFVYLAKVIDRYSKKVVGWSIADHMRTELVQDALNNAAATTQIDAPAIFHSDRGSAYTSADYRPSITGLGMRSSMGRTGVCWGNTMAESFFSALNNERVHRTGYATKAQARRDVIGSIEGVVELAPTPLRSGLPTTCTTVTPSRPRQRRETHQIRTPKSPQQESRA